MIYAVRHATTYRYADDVTLSSHRLRLSPRDTARQKLRRFAIEVTPQNHELVAERDSFGNASHLLEIREGHRTLVIEARSEVEVSAEEPELGVTPWEQAVDAARRPASPAALEASQFAFPSAYTAASDAIEDYARESFAPRRLTRQSVFGASLPSLSRAKQTPQLAQSSRQRRSRLGALHSQAPRYLSDFSLELLGFLCAEF
jgi:transglutaminase-like putative cysteine protease